MAVRLSSGVCVWFAICLILAPAAGARADTFYVTNALSNTVSRITAAGAVSTFASGFDQPVGIAVDGAGNLYVANNGNGTISKVTPGAGVSTFASGVGGPFGQPYGLAFDDAGNLFVSNVNDFSIEEVAPGGTVTPFVTSGLINPHGLAFDAAGNLYVADDTGTYTTGFLSRITPGGSVSTFASGLGFPEGLAFDAAGNLYVADNKYNGVVVGSPVEQIAPNGTTTDYALLVANIGGGLTFDSQGDLYVCSAYTGTISRISPSGVVSLFASDSLAAPLSPGFIVAVPTPEPSELALLAVAGLGVLVRRKPDRAAPAPSPEIHPS